MKHAWTKSSICGTDHVTEQCAEVKRNDDGTVAIRNNTSPDVVVNLSGAEWDTFLAGTKQGDFDDV